MACDPIERALRLSSGARFHRCALQVNPHHYGGTFRGQPNEGDADAFARAVVERAASLGVTVLAVTDHNNVDGIAAFRDAAEGTGIHLFPGFELASSEGVHVICIYPPGTSQDELGRYLGEFGITDTGPSSDPSTETFTGLLAKVRQRGGLAVAAHVTNAGGLFEKLSGQPRIRAWRDENLSAVQIPGPVDELPPEVRQILENRNADYRRDHPAGENLALAAVNARDVTAPDDLAEPSATCLVKMSEVGIEGLRQAFLDPGSRVRLNRAGDGGEEENHTELVGVGWESGGFLDGAAVHFNRNLNVLVGGRGTGKSTIIESLRYALGLEPIGDDARAAHEGIVRHVLRSGTKVSLQVKVYRPTPKTYRIERTVPNPPVVKDKAGEVSNLAPTDVVPGIEIFGQHEISELAKSPEKLTRLLGRFQPPDEDGIARRKKETLRDLKKNRQCLVDTRGELAQIDDRLAALPVLEETLVRFREAGLEDRLKEQSLIVREEHLLASVPDRLAAFHECLDLLQREIPIDRTFVSAKALEGLPAKDTLARLDAVLQQLEREVSEVAKRLEDALSRAGEAAAEVERDWSAHKRSVQEAYERILRDLQKTRVDGEEFIQLRRQIEELRPLRERQEKCRRLEGEHLARRRRLLDEWEDLKAAEYRRLERAAKRVSSKLRDRVKVSISAGADREPLFALLREKVGGRLSEACDALRKLDDLSLPRFVQACHEGPEAVAKAFSIPPAQARRLSEASPEVLMQIEELSLDPTTSILLNTAPPSDAPQWQELGELSTGQKATAVLLLLLLDSTAPLIVDQPEDDLDNRFITEGIVPRMREEKERRQFIFSTHNANIPVLGDAELIVGLTAVGEAEQGRACVDGDVMGSIDSAAVREFVEEILEGGKEAFERRRRKYGF